MIFPIPVVEPTRGGELMLSLNLWVNTHEIARTIVPLLADIFVFTYPVFLVVLYIVGVWKQRLQYKLGALTIFGSALFSSLVNIIIQQLTDKSRPEAYITNKQDLLLSHLPTDPFPSDHAAVSAAIAMATLLRARKTHNKTLYRISIFFWSACIVMSCARVAVAVHRPTDVLVGIGVGAGCAMLLTNKTVLHTYERYIAQPLISIEKYVLGLLRKRS